MKPRRVKNSSGFEIRRKNKRRIHDAIMRVWCLIVGHEEVGVYSWVSHCERCFLTFDPTDSDYWDEEE